MNKKLYKSIVINLLNSFNEIEKERLMTFLSNDYFNRDTSLPILLQSLIKHTKGENQISIETLHEIYLSIFSDRIDKSLSKKQKNAFDIKMSVLLQKMKRFLVVENLENHPAVERKILYQSLLDKQQLNLCYRQIKKDKKALQSNRAKDLTYFETAYEIENAYMNYLHAQGVFTKNIDYNKIVEYLDASYLLKKLQLHSTALSISRVFRALQYDFSTIEHVKELLFSNNYEQQVYIRIYQQIIQLMNHDDDQVYFDLLELLKVYEAQINIGSLSDFYNVACNFCIHKIKKGHLNYNQYLFDLYKKMEQKNLLTKNGIMDINKLKNIVPLSCKLGDFEWAAYLVKKHHKNINHSDSKSVYHFNVGVIAFYQSNYQNAIYHFIRVDKVNLLYEINCRMLMVKAHFELDEEYDERTMTIFRTIELYMINNNSLKASQKRGYKNFVRMLINLYKVKYQVGKGTPEKIIDKMNQLEFISDKKWLIEKVHELKH